MICHLIFLSKLLKKIAHNNQISKNIAHNNQEDDVGSNAPGDFWT